MEPLDEISVSKGYRVLGRLPDYPTIHDSLIQNLERYRTINASTEKYLKLKVLVEAGRNN